jgi:hypothetical protein
MTLKGLCVALDGLPQLADTLSQLGNLLTATSIRFNQLLHQRRQVFQSRGQLQQLAAQNRPTHPLLPFWFLFQNAQQVLKVFNSECHRNLS